MSAVEASGARPVLFRSGVTLGLTSGGMVVSAAVAWILARELGAEGYGAYAWAWAVTNALGTVATLGLEYVLQRELTRGRHPPGVTVALVARPLRRRVMATGFGLAAAAGVLAVAAGEALPEGAAGPLLLLLPAVPLISLAVMDQAQAQALGRPAAALLAWSLARPAWLGATAGAAAVAGALEPRLAAALATSATVVSWAGGRFGLRARAVEPQAKPRELGRAHADDRVGLALHTVALVLHAYLGVATIGLLAGTAEAGVLAVAVQLATGFALVRAAAARPLSPILSRLYVTDRAKLQASLVRATRWTAVATALPAVAVAAAADHIMRAFGAEFGEGVTALRILVAGHVLTSLVALSSPLLLVAGRGGSVARAAWSGLTVGAVLLVVLVPAWGITGGAAAVAAGDAVRNGLMCWSAWKLDGISTTVFGPTRRRSDRVG